MNILMQVIHKFGIVLTIGHIKLLLDEIKHSTCVRTKTVKLCYYTITKQLLKSNNNVVNCNWATVFVSQCS